MWNKSSALDFRKMRRIQNQLYGTIKHRHAYCHKKHIQKTQRP